MELRYKGFNPNKELSDVLLDIASVISIAKDVNKTPVFPEWEYSKYFKSYYNEEIIFRNIKEEKENVKVYIDKLEDKFRNKLSESLIEEQLNIPVSVDLYGNIKIHYRKERRLGIELTNDVYESVKDYINNSDYNYCFVIINFRLNSEDYSVESDIDEILIQMFKIASYNTQFLIITNNIDLCKEYLNNMLPKLTKITLPFIRTNIELNIRYYEEDSTFEIPDKIRKIALMAECDRGIISGDKLASVSTCIKPTFYEDVYSHLKYSLPLENYNVFSNSSEVLKVKEQLIEIDQQGIEQQEPTTDLII